MPPIIVLLLMLMMNAVQPPLVCMLVGPCLCANAAFAGTSACVYIQQLFYHAEVCTVFVRTVDQRWCKAAGSAPLSGMQHLLIDSS